MSPWFLFILATFVAAEPAVWPFNSGEITLETQPWTVSFQTNLIDQASFTLTHTAALQICFQENFPVPANASLWGWSCTFQYSFEAAAPGTVEHGMVPLRNSNYNVAIFFDGPQTTEKFTFTAGAVNDSCPEGKIFNSVDCVTPVPAIVNDPFSANFTVDAPHLYTFRIPDLTGSVLVEALDAQHPLNFAIRREGAPGFEDETLYDGVAGEVAEFNFPRPGIYYLFVNSTTAQQVLLNVSLEDCSGADHATGPGCKVEYNHDNAVPQVEAVEDHYYYWAIYGVGPSKPLRVSVASQEDGVPLPNIYASRGNVPQEGNADISNCNVEGCNSVNTIYWAATSNETWYVSVTPAHHANGTIYGIWFGSVCYPTCESGGGSCIADGPDSGICVCSDDDKGVGCQITTRVSQQYVVLGAIWGAALGVTIVVLIIYFMTSQKTGYEVL